MALVTAERVVQDTAEDTLGPKEAADIEGMKRGVRARDLNKMRTSVTMTMMTQLSTSSNMQILRDSWFHTMIFFDESSVISNSKILLI